MAELSLLLDNKAQESISDLMEHYKIASRAQIVSKAIAILKIAAHIEKTDGELFARKDGHETKIVVR